MGLCASQDNVTKELLERAKLRAQEDHRLPPAKIGKSAFANRSRETKRHSQWARQSVADPRRASRSIVVESSTSQAAADDALSSAANNVDDVAHLSGDGPPDSIPNTVHERVSKIQRQSEHSVSVSAPQSERLPSPPAADVDLTKLRRQRSVKGRVLSQGGLVKAMQATDKEQVGKIFDEFVHNRTSSISAKSLPMTRGTGLPSRDQNQKRSATWEVSKRNAT